MSPDTLAILAVLFAALLHAGWNTMVKTARSGFLTIALLQGWTGVLALPFAFFVSFPAPESWNLLALSVLIHAVYYAFLSRAYKSGDLSFSYPLARGSGPIVVALLSPLFAGETLSASGFLGVLAISFGILLIAAKRGAAFKAQRKALLYALSTGLLIGLYTMSDGMGARLSGSVAGYIVWLYIGEAVTILLVAAVVKQAALFEYAREQWLSTLRAALMAGTAYGIVIWALTLSEMAYIAALRETSVLFAAIIGAVFLNEPFGKQRILGAAVVASGIVLLNL